MVEIIRIAQLIPNCKKDVNKSVNVGVEDGIVRRRGRNVARDDMSH